MSLFCAHLNFCPTMERQAAALFGSGGFKGWLFVLAEDLERASKEASHQTATTMPTHVGFVLVWLDYISRIRKELMA